MIGNGELSPIYVFTGFAGMRKWRTDPHLHVYSVSGDFGNKKRDDKSLLMCSGDNPHTMWNDAKIVGDLA